MEQQQHPQADEKSAPLAGHADPQATPAAGTEGSADEPPIVFVEVNIAPGRPPEKLVLREGQSPAEAAAEFAVMHRLSPHLAQRLHVLLKELMAKPDAGQRKQPDLKAAIPRRFSPEPLSA